MFIELVDSLRCIVPHEDSWLVAGADRMDGRRIVDGTLGCPVCRARYEIRDGVAWFGAEPTVGAGREVTSPWEAPEAEAMRLAALLGVTDQGGRVLLEGAWGALAERVLQLVPVELLLVDPPAEVRAGEGISVVRTAGTTLPLAAASMRAAAADAPTGARLDAIAGVVRPGGRVVAPAPVPVPAELAELARDERHWVAERRAAPSAPVQLTMTRGRR